MIYVLLTIGAGLFIFGYIRDRKSGAKAFSALMGEAELSDELRLVNHTIGEQELSERLNEVLIELDHVKAASMRDSRRLDALEAKLSKQARANEIKKTTPETYKDVSQKLDSMKQLKSIDQLSKEMEIGKGELQLLQKLQKK